MKPSMQLLPPHPDACQECGRKHDPKLPHDKMSLYYQTNFIMKHGVAPTWMDAMAHCTLDMQVQWERLLREGGHWDA